jgi:uncharacterized alpha-E superfamily protein
MLSRVADSLYWMSRYMERSDGILRMLKINYASSQDDILEFSWKPVLRIFTYLSEAEANAIAHHSRDVLQYMVTDKENSNSVLNIVSKARENARSVQDNITKELWQCLNEFYHTVRDEQLVRRPGDHPGYADQAGSIVLRHRRYNHVQGGGICVFEYRQVP